MDREFVTTVTLCVGAMIGYFLGWMDGRREAARKRANTTEVEIKVVDAKNDICELRVNGKYMGRMPLKEALKYSFEREERGNGKQG